MTMLAVPIAAAVEAFDPSATLLASAAVAPEPMATEASPVATASTPIASALRPVAPSLA